MRTVKLLQYLYHEALNCKYYRTVIAFTTFVVNNTASMKLNLTLLLAAALLFSTVPASAQTEDDSVEVVTVTADDEVETMTAPSSSKKGYFSLVGETSLFQSAAFERPGMNRELTYLRFTFGVNVGVNYNYDFDDNFSASIGLNIKNIGFTDKIGDMTIKRRVYNLGIPIGFKVGNLWRKSYAIVGGGIDLPLNYREKSWTDRDDKKKMSEWFSDRTPDVMPFLFAGMSFKKGTVVKFTFYPSNFFNTSYEETHDGITTRPYRGYDARLLTFSLGFDLAMMSHKVSNK